MYQNAGLFVSVRGEFYTLKESLQIFTMERSCTASPEDKLIKIWWKWDFQALTKSKILRWGSLVKPENTKDCGNLSYYWMTGGPDSCGIHSKIVAKKEASHVFISRKFIDLFLLTSPTYNCICVSEKCDSFLILARIYGKCKEMLSTNNVTTIIMSTSSTTISNNSIIKMDTWLKNLCQFPCHVGNKGFFDLSNYRAKAIYVSIFLCMKNHLAIGKMKKNLIQMLFLEQMFLENECNVECRG